MSIYPTVAAILILVLMLFSHKTFFHPACAQAALWAFLLGGLWLLRDQFDDVSTSTLWFIVGSVVSFGLGGTVMSVFSASFIRYADRQTEIIAKDYSIFILILFPFLLYIINAVEPLTLSLSYFSLLKETYIESNSVTLAKTATIVALINVYIVIAYTCKLKTKVSLPFIAILTSFLTIIFAIKALVFLLATSLLFSSYYTKRLRLIHIGIGIICIIFLFSIITIVRIQDVDTGNDFATSFLMGYTLAAIPALDQQINSSYSHSGGNTFRIAYLLLNKVGFNFEVPPQGEDFVFVPYGTNVFTYLHPYWKDFGSFGAVFICFILGATHAYFHEMALRGNHRYIIIASLLSYPLLMQPFDDQYFHWLTNWIYIVLVIFLVTRSVDSVVHRNEASLNVCV